jgi:hypothetical protein
MSVDAASAVSGAFPWISPIADTLFVNDATPQTIGASGSCGSDADVCAAINFNNYAYGKAGVLTDGDTNTNAGSISAGDLNWFEAPIQKGASVQVWVFLDGTEAGALITCTGSLGTCTKTAVGWNFNHYYDCNCGTRSVHYDSGTKYTEIQIFGLFDLARSQFYTY